MKVKEIDRTANIAWSPSSHHPIYLAAGTAAQQLDATFSTTASLEVYDLNLTEPCLDMTLKGSIVSEYRFHKIVWGCMGMKSSSSENSSGLLVGGADGGSILVYDPAKIISGEDAVVFHKTKHSGPVHALDFNKFQECLLASGASDSEIFIWDLNNPATPMTPGVKSQPTDDVTCVAWNCQVQHILASTFPARCVVWDLRKNEPIIKVSDSASRLHCKMVAWHPEVATQLCLASDDDHSPLIQLWDLRFATTPVQNMEHHQRGVLSIAWCPQDPDLLLSCGKDNRILCWNPNSSIEGGEIVCELPTSSQWSFDVAWCPKNPAVIASSSCDGHVSVYSLMGGQQQAQCSSKIAESFPGSEKYVQPHVTSPAQRQVSVSLKRPPKWLRKPVGASFAFGGKLISFSNESASAVSQPGYQFQHFVYVSQVVTEPDILSKAAELESALNSANIGSYCIAKSDACQDVQEKMKWNFLEATFSPAPRAKMLSLLGYDYQKISAEIAEKLVKKSGCILQETSGDVTEEMSHLNFNENCDYSEFYDKPVDKYEEPFVVKANTGDTDGLLSRALLTGNIEAAVDLCVQAERWADALVLAHAGGHELVQKTQKLYFNAVDSSSSKLISAVASSDWLFVVKNCALESWKEALAAILTYAKPEEFASLCEHLGSRLESENSGIYMQNAALCYISAGNLERLAELWARENLSGISSLQSFVEQIMILRHAVEQLSGSAPPLQSGTLSSLLSQFGSLLASQGNLKSAAVYLVDSKEESCAILRDRIYQALGHPSPYFPFKYVDIQKEKVESSTQPQNLSRRESVSQAQKTSLYDTQMQQQQFPSYGVAPVQTSSHLYSYASSGSHPHYQTTLAPAVAPQSVVPRYQAPAPPPPAPASSIPSAVPPSTAAVSFPSTDNAGLSSTKGSSGHHLSQRYPKHLHDPSVYSEPSYGGQYLQSYGGLQSQVNNYSNPVTQQPMSYYSTEQSGATPFSSSHNMPFYPPASYSSYVSQVPQSLSSESLPRQSVPMQQQFPSMYGEMKTGWNDPPLLKQAAPKPPMSAFEPPSPITAPLVSATVPDMTQSSSVGAAGSQIGTPYAPQQPMQPLEVGVEATEQQKVPEPPKEKEPIPPEHQILQDTFEDLRQQCQQVATNPQTRRKLEDVAKKLENLYDQLREKSLSSAVTQGLHQIVHAILQGDYPSALSVHGQIVSSTNFSEISGFMPSVKVLLQTSSQLGVFLQ